MAQATQIAQLIKANEQQILEQWLSLQQSATTLRADLLKERELREQSREFLQQFAAAMSAETENIEAPAWKPVKDILASISHSRTAQGFTPSETATFVFSLKQPIFELLRREVKDIEKLIFEIWLITVLVDKLGLFTTGIYQHSRESVIARQQEELMELSTPVVRAVGQHRRSAADRHAG